MSILDAVLILFILGGLVLGFKKGAIRSLVGLVGLVVLVVVSYYLKNPVADFLFNFVPFFKFSGAWEGLTTLNILLYEGVSYLIVFFLLSGILSLVLKVTGVVEKILNMTIILGIPSKIIGAVLGLLEAVVLSFIFLFVLLQLNSTHDLVKNSSLANSILDKTPVIGVMVNDTYKAIKEIEDLNKKYKNDSNKDVYNCEILGIMLSKEVVTPEVVQKLIDNKKLDFVGASSVLESFKEE